MLQDLKHILDTETRCATFTCGGKLPISLHPNVGGDGNLTPRTEEKVNDQRILTKGVTIRWGGDGEGQVITLPSQHAEAVEDLVKACVPATFALGGKYPQRQDLSLSRNKSPQQYDDLARHSLTYTQF